MIQNTKIWTIVVVAILGLTFFLNLVFSAKIILPQTFHLGPLIVHYYGIFMALAVVGGFYLAKKSAAKYGISEKNAEDIIFWLIIGGFVGARLYHVLSSLDYYLDHPSSIFKVWQGGLSIYGAVFGGLFVIWFLAKRYTLNATRLLNWLTPSLILGQIIGRFGNLFNYEAFGYPTNLPWKMFVPYGFRPERYLNAEFFHPWFLYEQVGLILIFVFIRSIRKSDRSENQGLFLYYLLLYNILRFGLEFLRIDSTFLGEFRLNSIISLGFIIASILILRQRTNG